MLFKIDSKIQIFSLYADFILYVSVRKNSLRWFRLRLLEEFDQFEQATRPRRGAGGTIARPCIASMRNEHDEIAVAGSLRSAGLNKV